MNAIVFFGLISLAVCASIPFPKQRENVICYACPVLIEMLEKLVADDPSLLTTLETDGTAFCEKLPIPTSYKAYCQQFVDAALPDLIKALENDLPPSKVCADAFGCTTSETFGSIKMAKLMAPLKKMPFSLLSKPKSLSVVPMAKLTKATNTAVKTGGIECEGCETLLKMIDSQLTDPTFQSTVIADLLKVCTAVPAQYQSECTSTINTYGAELLKTAAAELNPTTACAALNLCSAQTKFNTFMSLIGAQSTTDGLCNPCKYAAQEAASYLKQYLPQLMQQLNGVCAALPADLQTDCKNFINQYGQKVADDIINNPNLPTEACTYAGLCTTSVPLSYKKCVGNQFCNRAYNRAAVKNNQVARAVIHPQNKEAVLCEMCGVFFGYIATELNSTQIQNDITDAVDIACAVFPDNMQAGCEQLVGTYIPMALTDAANALNPNTMCLQLKACP